MPQQPRLKENYTLAKCCSPAPGCEIVGYYSHDGVMLKVHRSDCGNLAKAERARLVSLAWDDIQAEQDFTPGDDYAELEALDFRVLKHHRDLGVDYSHKVARVLHAGKQAVFDSHRKLRAMGLLKRVDPVMIRYRKGIVDNKWIKHRNHTYYQLTDKGNDYFEFYLKAIRETDH